MTTGRAVSVWLGIAAVAMVGSLWTQRQGEAALTALPPDDLERVAERMATPSRVALGAIAVAVALFVALGRGSHALAVAVTLLLANAAALLGARWWTTRDVAGAGPWRAWAVAQAVASAVMFLAVAGHLRGW